MTKGGMLLTINDRRIRAAFAKAPGEVEKGWISGATEAGMLLTAAAVAGAPVGASADLRNSIHPALSREGTMYVLKVGSAMEHALVIHDGRKAGSKWPPQGELIEWLKFKGIPTELEFVIRRKIGIEGFEGRPFLRNALSKNKAQIKAILMNHMDIALKRIAA